MLPPAPARFSTTIGCFQRSVSFCPTVRAMVSTAPPAVNGTTTRTGLTGKFCAAAFAAINAHAAAIKPHLLICVFSPVRFSFHLQPRFAHELLTLGDVLLQICRVLL